MLTLYGRGCITDTSTFIGAIRQDKLFRTPVRFLTGLSSKNGMVTRNSGISVRNGFGNAEVAKERHGPR
ncbi:hypothetical protein [Paenibacillus graminis]|uniref:hypothetical protein n=1 Tax=Paenibacillus graminis TaxID=189425 RepID=UPI0004B57A4B|nr:hypothetical protein [Paenibacillus graminis]